MKSILLMTMMVCLALPMSAQSTEAGLWITRQMNEDGGHFAAGDDAEARFDDGSGYGVSVSRRLGARLSGELALFRTSASAGVLDGSMRFNLGDVELTPITAMLRFHFAPEHRFDVHVGAGLAYVQTGDLDSADLRTAGLAPVRLEDETKLTFGAGATISISPRVALGLDARYIPLDLGGRIPDEPERFSADFNPLLLSAGIKLRF